MAGGCPPGELVEHFLNVDLAQLGQRDVPEQRLKIELRGCGSRIRSAARGRCAR